MLAGCMHRALRSYWMWCTITLPSQMTRIPTPSASGVMTQQQVSVGLAHLCFVCFLTEQLAPAHAQIMTELTTLQSQLLSMYDLAPAGYAARVIVIVMMCCLHDQAVMLHNVSAVHWDDLPCRTGIAF